MKVVHRTKFIPAILLLFSAFSVASNFASDAQLAEALAASGLQLYEQRQFESASRLLLNALINDTECPEALYGMALTYEAKNETFLSGVFFKRAQLHFKQLPRTVHTQNRITDIAGRLRCTNSFADEISKSLQSYADELARLVPRGNSVTAEFIKNRYELLALNLHVRPEVQHVQSSVIKTPQQAIAQASSAENAEAENKNRCYLKLLGRNKLNERIEQCCYV